MDIIISYDWIGIVIALIIGIIGYGIFLLGRRLQRKVLKWLVMGAGCIILLLKTIIEPSGDQLGDHSHPMKLVSGRIVLALAAPPRRLTARQQCPRHDERGYHCGHGVSEPSLPHRSRRG